MKRAKNMPARPVNEGDLPQLLGWPADGLPKRPPILEGRATARFRRFFEQQAANATEGQSIMKQAKRTPAPQLVSVVEQTTAKHSPTPATPAKSSKKVQLNFSCSEELCFTINEQAIKEGGIRPFIARILKEAGYPVPEADLEGKTFSRRVRA
jgi:hypothetical protein